MTCMIYDDLYGLYDGVTDRIFESSPNSYVEALTPR